MKSTQHRRQVVIWIGGAILSVLVFLLALFLPIPPAVGRFLKYGTGLSALLLTFVFWLLLSQRNNWFRLVELIAVILLFAIPLSWLWQSDTADWSLLGGIIPVSDASIYTMDAGRLIHGASFSSISSFRPMANGFLAVLLKLANWDMQLVTAALGLLVAVSTYALVKEVQQMRGAVAASVTLVVMFLFSRIYMGKVLTEPLGITFAALAFTLLIKGARKNERFRVVVGIGMLTMAMNVRAGAYFAIPALLLWAALIFRGTGFVSKRVLAGGLILIVAAFGLNSLVLRSVGAKEVIPFANVADTFYGLAAGYQGWRAAKQDHPGASSSEKFQFAFELIKSQPSLLLKGIAMAYLDFFNPASYNVFSFMNFHIKEGGNLHKGIPGKENSAVYLPVFVLGALGLVRCLKGITRWQGMILAGWAGMLASVPLVPPVDAGIRPYAVTIPLVGFLLGEGAAFIFERAKQVRPVEISEQETSDWPALFSLILIPLVVAGPILVKNIAVPISAPAPLSCEDGEAYLFLQPVKNARIDIVSDGQNAFRRPAMGQSLYLDNAGRQSLPPELVARLTELSAGQSVQYAVEIGSIEQNLLPVILISDTHLLPQDALPFQICGQKISDSFMALFYTTHTILPGE